MEIDPLKELKSVARKFARAHDVKHIRALAHVATSIGFPHWNALTVAHKKGWMPSADDIATAEALIRTMSSAGSSDANTEHEMKDEPVTGEILGHAYRVSDTLHDTFVRGRGWEVVLPEAPLAPPQFLVTDRRLKANPIADQSFRNEALAIATRWRQRIHTRIASDWPSRSTQPDSAGRAEHPLHRGVSETWWCMHCDGSFTSSQITANLFYCPTCLASPLDIHTSPWWLKQEQAKG